MKTAGQIFRALLPFIALGFLLIGCAGKDTNPLSPSAPPAAGGTVSYTAVGASDTMGWGSSAWCVPFTDCPNGTGYVPVIVRRLKGMGATVSSSNLGIPGAFIGPDFESLANQFGTGFPGIPGYDIKGNLIDSEAPFVPKDSTVVTIFAGGNDVRTVARALELGAGSGNPQAYLDQQITNFKNDYNARPQCHQAARAAGPDRRGKPSQLRGAALHVRLLVDAALVGAEDLGRLLHAGDQYADGPGRRGRGPAVQLVSSPTGRTSPRTASIPTTPATRRSPT